MIGVMFCSRLKAALLLWCVALTFILSGCSSESAYVKNEPILDMVKMAPFHISVNQSKATVSFVQTPVPLEIDLSEANGINEVSLVQRVIGQDIPLKVFIVAGTNKVARIEAASDAEVALYQEDLVRADNEIANRPDPALLSIFPDEATLESAFNMLMSHSCSQNNESGCLTFQYAGDGCNARAHKMKQLLNAAGYNCQKHYIFGNLIASAGACCANWVYHTAPLVLVNTGNGVIEERILDPSLFTTPVRPEVWRTACQNSVCVFNPEFEFGPVTYATVPGIVFYYDPVAQSFRLDSDYFKTDCTLGVYLNESGCGFPSHIPPDNCQN